MNKITTVFMKIGKGLKVTALKISNFVSDILTIFRKKKGGVFSSRRIYAAVCLCCGLKLLFVGVTYFTQLTVKGWVSALVFVPGLLGLLFAAVFSYFSSAADWHTAAADAKSLIEAAKQNNASPG